jgi:hypothetical protein
MKSKPRRVKKPKALKEMEAAGFEISSEYEEFDTGKQVVHWRHPTGIVVTAYRDNQINYRGLVNRVAEEAFNAGMNAAACAMYRGLHERSSLGLVDRTGEIEYARWLEKEKAKRYKMVDKLRNENSKRMV